MPEPCFISPLPGDARTSLFPSSFLPWLLQRGFDLILKFPGLGNHRQFIHVSSFLSRITTRPPMITVSTSLPFNAYANCA